MKWLAVCKIFYKNIKIFTTRPDTVFGATYVVLAPEHPLITTLLDNVLNKKAVDHYIATTAQKTERERSENKEKTGVVLEGISATNPATKEEIPIYIADYVLASYGTGAVMAVPAHDERDFEFAQKMELPIIKVIENSTLPYVGAGILINSGEFDGRDTEEAKWDIVAYVGGEKATQYRIRDWLVSRQRYWGCPIPIVYDPEGKPHAIPAEHLPWLLPTDVDFTPTGKAPLASSKELKERVTRVFGEGWTPEYDTLDTFVDSSWYFLRYLDPKDAHNFSDTSLMKKWLPINRYSGGSEHTTMHLLYARFFIKALHDLALVPIDEPFTERFNRGLIMGPDGQKMSKSKGNVINPDDFVNQYGADAVRLYLAFIGPYNEPGSYPWNLDGVAAMRKFLDRIMRFIIRSINEYAVPISVEQAVARASVKVAKDGDRFKFNTGVAALMILVNELEACTIVPASALAQLAVMLAPFAPHLAEHVWGILGKEGSVHTQSWPVATPIASIEREVVVQVNGKRRGSMTLTLDASENEAVVAAREILSVSKALSGNEPKRVIYVPGKVINIVV
jgi:leucyl-tRNA synthetase